jgi:peptide/nickel transport system substrate-binding protein
MRRTIAIVCGFLVSGCVENPATQNVENGGTLVIATAQDPETLFPPFVETTSGKQITEQIYDYLADVGPTLDIRDSTFRRELADGWRWSDDSLSLAFHVDPRAKWHDGRKVTAGDVRFTFELNKSPVVAGRYVSSLNNIDSVTVTDSLTAVFWFHSRRPSQFLDAAAQLLILPAHQLERTAPQRLRETVLPPPIGSGRFRLRRWDRGTTVEIVADTANYRGRARLDRVIWSLSPDATAAVARLVTGDADLFDTMRPEDVRQIAGRSSLRVVTLTGVDYAFLRFNLRDPAHKTRPHPLFGDRELRRALTMSIDRNALVRSVFDTLALVPVGPTVRAYQGTDARLVQIPYDSARASRLLDSLGWVRTASGERARNGRKLAFTILVPGLSANRQRMGVLLQEQLRRMGVHVNTDRMDNSAQNAREVSGDFDASLDSWTLGANPDGTRDAWTSIGIGKNGVNYGAYSNPRFDALLDSALFSDAAHARDKFTAAYQIINDDAPAVWLYEPKKVLGIHRRFRISDRTRPDAWWFSLADWYVPPTERILRDRLPLSR